MKHRKESSLLWVHTPGTALHHPSFSMKEELLLVCVLASAGCWYHGTAVNNTLNAQKLLSDKVIPFNEITSCSKLATSASEGETRGKLLIKQMKL